MLEIKSGLTNKTTADCASRKDLATVPGKMDRIGTESGLGREGERAAVKVG